MRKIILLALVVLTSASFNIALAGDRKGKKKDKKGQPTQLVTTYDSLSYAAGMMATKGLTQFLRQNYGIEESDMPEFLRGFQDAVSAMSNARAKGYAAGVEVAGMANGRIIASQEKDLKGAFATDTLLASLFNEGFIAALKQDHSLITDSMASKIVEGARKATVDAAKHKGEVFLAENKTKEGVVALPSGLQYKVLRQGNGPIAKADDEVVVKYEGRLIDGTVFDSSYERNPQTSTFRPNQVIKGWTEALTLMPQGSKWELYIPQELAYGARQAGKIPAYSPLIFIVEVEEVKAKAK
mgnify:CR=1 FL=1